MHCIPMIIFSCFLVPPISPMTKMGTFTGSGHSSESVTLPWNEPEGSIAGIARVLIEHKKLNTIIIIGNLFLSALKLNDSSLLAMYIVVYCITFSCLLVSPISPTTKMGTFIGSGHSSESVTLPWNEPGGSMGIARVLSTSDRS